MVKKVANLVVTFVIVSRIAAAGSVGPAFVPPLRVVPRLCYGGSGARSGRGGQEMSVG